MNKEGRKYLSGWGESENEFGWGGSICGKARVDTSEKDEWG